MAQLGTAVGGAAVGGVIGFAVGGPGGAILGAQLGFTGGAILGAILFPNKTETDAPAVADIRITSTATGRFIPIIFGVVRLAGQTIWAREPVFITTEEEVGGKGGGGAEVKSTTVLLSWMNGICEGPIKAVTRIWFDSRLVFDISDQNLTGQALDPLLADFFVDDVTGTPGVTSFEDNVQTIQMSQFGPIRIYLGGEGQPIDPMLQLDTRIGEAFGGTSSDFLPGFHGLAIAAFESINGEITNGHFPQVEFEVLKDSTEAAPIEHFEPVPTRDRRNLLKDRNTLVITTETDEPIYRWNMVDKNVETPEEWAWDTPPTPGGTFPPQNIGTWDDPSLLVAAVSTGGSFFWTGNADTGTWGQSRATGPVAQIAPDIAYYYPNTFAPTRVVFTQGSLDFIRTHTLRFAIDLDEDPIERGSVAVPEIGINTLSFTNRPGLMHEDGLLYLASGETGSSRRCIVAFDPVTLKVRKAALPYLSSPDSDDPFFTSCEMTYDPVTDKIILISTNGTAGGTMRRMDRETLILDGVPDIEVSISFSNGQNYVNMKHGPWHGILWVSGGFDVYHEIDVWNWQVLRTIVATDTYTHPQLTGNNFTHMFDPWNQGLWVADFLDTDQLHLLFLGRHSPLCPSAADIADEVSDRCEISSTLRNTSLWDPFSICGYIIGRRISGRKALAPIAAAINGDYRTQDGIVQFFVSDTASLVTIPEDDLEFLPIEDDPQAPPNFGWPYERELPYRVDVQFIDRELDYDNNNAGFDRPLEDFKGRKKETVSMPIVFWGDNSNPTPDEIAERILYQFDINRDQHGLRLSWEHLQLNVGDAFSYTHDGTTWTVRAEKWGLGDNNQVLISAKSEDILVNTPSGQAGVEAPVIFEPPSLPTVLSSRFWLIDETLLRDVDDDADGIPVYVAAAASSGSNDDWPGGLLRYSTDGGSTFSTLETLPASAAVSYGRTETALPTTDRPHAFDRTSTLQIQMVRGVLPGPVLETDLDEDRTLNALLVGSEENGWEVIRYSTITNLEGSPDEENDTYTISNLRRGLRGTSHRVGSHGVGDWVIVLDKTKLRAVVLPSSDLNVERHYKFQTIGQSQALAFTKTFTLAGGSKKPYSLACVSGTRNISTGTWTVNAVRRTRIGGGWVDFIEPPLGEQSEDYECDVSLTSGGAVVASKTGLTSPSTTFTGSELGFSPDTDSPFTIYVKWYQVSATVGRGYTEEVCLTSPTPGN